MDVNGKPCGAVGKRHKRRECTNGATEECKASDRDQTETCEPKSPKNALPACPGE